MTKYDVTITYVVDEKEVHERRTYIGKDRDIVMKQVKLDYKNYEVVNIYIKEAK